MFKAKKKLRSRKNSPFFLVIKPAAAAAAAMIQPRGRIQKVLLCCSEISWTIFCSSFSSIIEFKDRQTGRALTYIYYLGFTYFLTEDFTIPQPQKIRRSTFSNCIKFVDRRFSRHQNCEMLDCVPSRCSIVKCEEILRKKSYLFLFSFFPGWHRQCVAVPLPRVPERRRGLPPALRHPPRLRREAHVLHGDRHGPVRPDLAPPDLEMRANHEGNPRPV